jgi:hypothetical protein
VFYTECARPDDCLKVELTRDCSVLDSILCMLKMTFASLCNHLVMELVVLFMIFCFFPLGFSKFSSFVSLERMNFLTRREKEVYKQSEEHRVSHGQIIRKSGERK